MTIYAIGDIHGHADKLAAAHDLVEDDRAREGTSGARLVHIGDLVDRGPDSAAVIETLIALAARDPRVVTLLGNHDELFLTFLTRPLDEMAMRGGKPFWLNANMGGTDTLASYGIRGRRPARLHLDARTKVPASHREFLAALPRSFASDGCFFAHAGIRPGVPLEAQDPQDLIWIREDFLWSTADHGPLIVHGHTPVDRVEHWGNRLNIDTGAAYGRALSAVAIEDRRAFLLTDGGRVEIT